jgi:hypothetical protein
MKLYKKFIYESNKDNILKFNKFSGKIKQDYLEKEEVIELVNLITELKPKIPEIIPKNNLSELSKLVDNINFYTSEDGNYKISVYFRESDIYYNKDGSITHGQFKSLFKITIKKEEGLDLKISDLKDYINLTSSIIKDVYPDSKLIIKFDNKKITIEDFNLIDVDLIIDKLVLIIRII